MRKENKNNNTIQPVSTTNRESATQRMLSDFIKNILICFLKMNEGLMGLERHEGE